MGYKTIGYQTLEDRNNPDEVERNAPYKCISKKAWLSYGYYFWEKDFQRAKEWGGKNFPHGYIIIKCNLYLENMLDLVGNRDHQKELIKQHKTLKQKFPEKFRNKTLSKIIIYLRDLNESQKGIFNYDSVRAQDHPSKIIFKFRDDRTEVMDLNPRIQICLFEKSSKNLKNGIKIVHPNIYLS